jgi:hypothetical protein
MSTRSDRIRNRIATEGSKWGIKRPLEEIDPNIGEVLKKVRPDSAKNVSKLSDYNKMTVKDLQQELRSRLIYKKGTKSQLVRELQADDREEQRDELQKKNKDVLKEGKYEDLKIPGLKAELEARELKLGGTKAELVERLHQDDRDRVHKGEQDKLFKEEIKRDENEKTIDYAKEAERLLQDRLPNYEKMQLPEVKEKLKEQGLMVKGTLEEIRERLKLSHIQSTIEYKQIMEKDCRERRKRFEEYREEKGIEETHSEESSRHYNKYKEVKKRGPKAKPLFNDFGYPLSYDKLMGQPTRYDRSMVASDRRMNHYEQKAKQTEEKAKIMGVSYEPGGLDTDMDWIVAMDLEIPPHTVELSDYYEWQKRGFKADEERVKRQKEEDREVASKMMCGSAFLVGYVS